ncbi:MAG: hypothetical protein NTV73_00565 [Hyphomicrobiales bacterium]|nr:hypothetical protein [Hyphomicrobiales bacterium]
MSAAFEPTPRPGLLEETLGWLRDATAVLVHSGAQVSALSDRDLADIGVRPRLLSSSIHREIGKPGLVDFGWRLGR